MPPFSKLRAPASGRFANCPGAFAHAARGLAIAAAFVTVTPSARAAPSSPPESATTAPPIVPPILLSSATVAYPPSGTGDATVVLALTVNADGTIRKATAIDGEEPFASAAATAVVGWRFEPARRGGKAIASVVRFEVTFHAAPAASEASPRSGRGSAQGERSRSDCSWGASRPPCPSRGSPPGIRFAQSNRGTTYDASKASPAKPAGGAVASASRGGQGPPETDHEPATASPSVAPEVMVRGERTAPGVTTFTRAEVRQLPGAFGDPFRAIEAMPGVTPIVSGLPFFYVRGAPPGNVGYFFDGVRVPYLYHVGLGPSVVNPAMVDRVDLYPGGYPAMFGRFSGGIVAGESTAPRDDFHGEGNLRLFDAGVLAETGFDGGRGTVLVGGRYSYTATILSLIVPDVKLDYRDYQARVTYDLTPHDRLTAFGFGSYDLLGQTTGGVFGILFGSEFYRLDLRYDHSFSDGGTLRYAVTLGYDQTRVADERNAQDRMVSSRVEFHHPVKKGVVLRAGADTTLDGYTEDKTAYVDPDDPTIQAFDRLFPARTDLAMGAWADLVLDVAPRIQITPGVRVDLFSSGGVALPAIDPRIAARFAITKHVTIVHADGIAHQPPSFIVPVPGLVPGSLNGGLQTSFQSSAGVEAELPWDLKATATVFDNVFLNMSDVLGTNLSNLAANLQQRALGSAVGFELFVRRNLTKKLGGFLTYTLSRSTRAFGSQEFPSAFDRTHVFNAALGYDLGKGWRAGTRIVFYTGTPKIIEYRGAIAPPPSQSPEREPSFYRLDLRLEKRWKVGKSGWLAFVAEVLNATLNKEVVQTQTIGPVTIPSIGLEGGF